MSKEFTGTLGRAYKADPQCDTDPMYCVECKGTERDSSGYCDCGCSEFTDDPSPYCGYCNAWNKSDCECGPTVENN